MVNYRKSLDEYKVIAALLCDVQLLHSEVFTPRSLRLTLRKMSLRYEREGIGLLTKTFARLGKALDRALSGEVPLDATKLPFKRLPNSQLPRFLGELFQCIFSHDGWILPTPCVRSIKSLRLILYCFYKYEVPYDVTLEQDVIAKFVKTEDEVSTVNASLSVIAERLASNPRWKPTDLTQDQLVSLRVARRARRLLWRLFSSFDPMEISPRHGPGAVADKATLWDKYTWKTISPRLAAQYPLDAYFFASLGHVCDSLAELNSIKLEESSARVILVPKDSRGPRLISCEPLAFQWIQQGLGRAIVRHVEHHALTMYNIHFTDQSPNQCGALLGSSTGRYATLDLAEASDRVTVGLVRLLFPEHISDVLLNCRTLSTALPGGEELPLHKFAPMGSALCFPVLALCVWAILTAAMPDTDARESVLVYGDDVIVPTAQAANAIEQLEAFGLKVNRDKSCISGLFRESCGMDAYLGECVTPVRFRTVWSSSRCPDVYVSWIAYANSCYSKRYYNAHDYIVRHLTEIYGEIPQADMFGTEFPPCPALLAVPEAYMPSRRRSNQDLQRLEYYVWDVRPKLIQHEIDGWKMLLRFFSNANSGSSHGEGFDKYKPRRSGMALTVDDSVVDTAFSVRSYTKRSSSTLKRRWLPERTNNRPSDR